MTFADLWESLRLIALAVAAGGGAFVAGTVRDKAERKSTGKPAPDLQQRVLLLVVALTGALAILCLGTAIRLMLSHALAAGTMLAAGLVLLVAGLIPVGMEMGRIVVSGGGFRFQVVGSGIVLCALGVACLFAVERATAPEPKGHVIPSVVNA